MISYWRSLCVCTSDSERVLFCILVLFGYYFTFVLLSNYHLFDLCAALWHVSATVQSFAKVCFYTKVLTCTCHQAVWFGLAKGRWCFVAVARNCSVPHVYDYAVVIIQWLHHDILNPPQQRLISRKPLWCAMIPTDIKSQWRESWKSATVVNAHLVDDPTIQLPGFTLPWQQWSLLNRFCTSQGHCGACRKT